MKIKIGHNIRVMNGMDNYTGVVIKINDHMKNKHLPYVDIRVFDPTNKQEIRVCSASDHYVDGDFSIIFLTEVDKPHLVRILKQYKASHDTPSKLYPNKFYPAGLEIYVKTKKDWFKLIKTTAKMAVFDGGRCALTNVTNIRRTK